MNKEYYDQQIKGLILILKDNDDDDCMIARSYVIEKLEMIKSGHGINFHPLIKEAIGMKTGIDILDEE